MASNSEEAPPDMDKLLFAEDIISHFMNKLVYKNYPFSSVNTAPRSERYRKYVYCGFDENVRKAVDILWKSLRRKAHEHFMEIDQRNAINPSSFDEYETRLKERYISDGLDAEDFMKYCVMLAVMTKHFFKCNYFDMPDRAFDFILKRFPLREMGEVCWGLLSRVARRIVRDHEKFPVTSSSSSDSDPSPDPNSQNNNGCDCFKDKIEGKDFLIIYKIRNDAIAKHQSKCVFNISRQERSLRLLPEPSTSKGFTSTKRKSSKRPKTQKGSEKYSECKLPDVSVCDPIAQCVALERRKTQPTNQPVSDLTLSQLTDELRMVGYIHDKKPALDIYNDIGRNLYSSEVEQRDSGQPPRAAEGRSAIGDDQWSTSQFPDASYQNLLKSYKEKSSSESNPFGFSPEMMSMINKSAVESYLTDYSQPSTSQQLEASFDYLPQFYKDEKLTNQQNKPPERSPNRQRTSKPATSDLEDHNSHRLTIFRREIKAFFASEANQWVHVANQAEKNADMEYKFPDIDYEYLFAASSDTKTTFKSECSKAPSEVGSGSHSAETGNGQPNKDNVLISDDIGNASSFTAHVTSNQEVSNVSISDGSRNAPAPADQVPSNQEVSDVPISDDSDKASSLTVKVTSKQEVSKVSVAKELPSPKSNKKKSPPSSPKN